MATATLTSYLVIRHGSNAANQSMTQEMAVGIVDAFSEEAARKIAAANFTCYSNQFLSFVSENDLTEDEIEQRNDIYTEDAELISRGEESVIFCE
jgi:hypothetical protein